jgi:hypothetical protein
MSQILKLSEDRLDEIIPFIEKYERKVADAEPIFKIEGQKLENVCKNLPHHLSSYDQSFQEMKALQNWLEVIKEKRISGLWRKYNEKYPRQLSAKDIQCYINGEPEIVEMNQVIIEVEVLKNQLQSIVEALKQLGWMTSHITKLRIAEMQDAIL